eukprot:16206945-Heterocapsa_arctica.AAC.1
MGSPLCYVSGRDGRAGWLHRRRQLGKRHGRHVASPTIAARGQRRLPPHLPTGRFPGCGAGAAGQGARR